MILNTPTSPSLADDWLPSPSRFQPGQQPKQPQPSPPQAVCSWCETVHDGGPENCPEARLLDAKDASTAPAPATAQVPTKPPRKPRRKKGEPSTTEYTILIDSQEKSHWAFTGLQTNAAEGSRPIIVQTDWRSLGRGMGDYTLAEAEVTDPTDERRWRISIERKSISDLVQTVLSERARFTRELANLNAMEFAAVIVEANWEDLTTYVAEHWERDGVPEHTRNARRKSVFGSIVSWQMPDRYPNVRWIFAGTKRGAEVTAFLLLDRFWRKVLKVEREGMNNHGVQK